MVLSDKEGLGRRGTVRGLLGGSSRISSISLATDASTVWDLVAACCIEGLAPLSISTGIVVLMTFFARFSGTARPLSAYLVGSGGGTFTAARGRGNPESLGIPDAWRFL